MTAAIRIRWAAVTIGPDEEREVIATLRSGQLSMGPRVRALEERLADELRVPHVIATSTGTAALDVAMKALGIGIGDEVIVPAFTYVATANAVVYQGATPVFVDVEPRTLNLDPAAVRAAIGPRTRCIVPIDYGGTMADYDALEAIAGAHGVVLLQDAAHSFGGSRAGRGPGAFGIGGTLSFHAAKVVTTIEGGAVVTHDARLAEAARSLRNQGEVAGAKYRFGAVGHNYRMTDLHAAIGLAQLRRFSAAQARRRAVVRRYGEVLAGAPGLTLPCEPADGEHAWFLYSVRFRDRDTRDRAEMLLREAGVETRICWPLPVYRQQAHVARAPRDDCPEAERAAATVLSLPLHAELDLSDVDLVCATIRAALGE
jgi:perosamine synthetase